MRIQKKTPCWCLKNKNGKPSLEKHKTINIFFGNSKYKIPKKCKDCRHLDAGWACKLPSFVICSWNTRIKIADFHTEKEEILVDLYKNKAMEL